MIMTTSRSQHYKSIKYWQLVAWRASQSQANKSLAKAAFDIALLLLHPQRRVRLTYIHI